MRLPSSLFVAFVFALAALAYQNVPSAVAEPKSAIEGRILNLKTGAPVKKAVVELTGLPARSGALQIELARETDAEGHFTFAGLEAGRYDLSAWRDGYLKQDSAATAPIILDGSEQRGDILLKLRPLSVISGRILDENGEPVADLEVEALRLEYQEGKREWVRTSTATTSDQGEYRMTKLTPGRYLVMTRPHNSELVKWTGSSNLPLPETPEAIYPGTYYPAASDETAAIPVPVTTGAEVRGIDISLSPVNAYRIRGTIVKPGGMAAVVAWERKGGGPRQIYANISASENKFELRGMTPGTYVIYIEPEDSEVRALARQTVVITDRHVDGLVMNMAPAGEIHGRVRIEDAPTPDLGKLSVQLRTSAIYFEEPTAVAANLSFLLKDVAPAHFEVSLSGIPENCFIKSIRYGSVDIGEAGSEFIDGNTLEITLSGAAGEIDGFVVREGKSAPGATVVLVRNDMPTFRIIKADQTGAFRLSGLKPGDYRVLAAETTDPDSIEPMMAKAERLTVEPNGRQSLHLELIPQP